MAEAIAFDTHRFVKNLTASGFTEAQAEALADEQVHLLNSNLATKADIRELKTEIQTVKTEIQTVRAEIQTVRADLEVKIEKVRAEMQTVRADLEVKIEEVRAEIQTVKADLLKWMVGALTAHAALIAGVVAGLMRLL